MNETNTGIVDYFLLPRIEFQEKFLFLYQNNPFEIDAYRYKTLDAFYQTCARQIIGSELKRISP
jgi:hypothetical protein